MGKRRTRLPEEVFASEKGIDWQEAVEKFVTSLKVRGLSYYTQRWHKENLKAMHKLLQKNNLVTEPGLITQAMLEQVVLAMMDKGLSPTTINHRVRSTKQLYNYLVQEGLVSKNPAEKLNRKKAPARLIETFSEEQIRALLAAPDKSRFVGLRDYVIMLLLIDTGIRLSELVNIQLADINLVEGELIITRGKGGKPRRVYLSPKTREALKKYLKARGDTPGITQLFITAENRPMTRRNVQERLAIYGQKARLEGVRVSPHTFRHTFARLYITAGGDPFSLQALLGHATLDMVRHYVNLWGNDLQRMHRQYSPVGRLL